MEEYTFSSGLMNFSRTQGKPGFTWKFILAYVVVSLIMFVIMGVLSALVAPAFVNELATTGSAFTNNGAMVLIMFGFMLVGALIMSVFEAAALRRYIHGTGFSLKFGGEELRLLGVYLVWFVILLLSYFVLVLVFGLISTLFLMGGVAAGGATSVITVFIGFLIMMAIPLILLGIVAKVSSASAMTIRDGKFTFFPAARVTMGRFWKVYFSYIIVYVAIFIVMLIAQLILTVIILSIGQSAAPSAAASAVTVFAVLAVVGILPVITAFGQLVTLGMTSKLVLTDPEWKGRADRLAETFN